MKTESKTLKYIVIGVLIAIAIPLTVKIKHSFFNKELKSTSIKTPNSLPYTTSTNEAPAKLISEGLALIRARKYQESIEINLKALEIAPNNALINNNIGYAYACLKKWDKSLIYLSKAVEIDKNFQLAQNNYNWVKSEIK